MPYVIKTNDGMYAKQSTKKGKGWSFVKDKEDATSWKDKEKTQIVINTSLGIGKKYKEMSFSIEEFNDKNETPKNTPIKKEEKAIVVNEEKEDATKIDKEKHPLSFIEDEKDINIDFSILEITKEVIEWGKGLEKKKRELLEQLSQADLEIVDIEHAIEFYTLNARDGYKLYKKLHDVRIKRRNIKDELQMLSVLEPNLSAEVAHRLEKNINGLNNRKYTPRTNIELFK